MPRSMPAKNFARSSALPRTLVRAPKLSHLVAEQLRGRRDGNDLQRRVDDHRDFVHSLQHSRRAVRQGRGCRDTRAIGLHTTSTVVQCIVVVILLDALFAVVLQEMKL